jgi:hypothetical protein
MQEVHIEYLTEKNINKKKWDHCISNATNGLIYGYSYYLDYMADHWDALVLNDYEAVMPLPWRKKYYIHYLYQPFLTAQLGVFGNDITADILEAFLKAIPSKFRYWDISLNHENNFPVSNFPLYQRANYILNLSPTYEELYNNYRENVKRNIKRSANYSCRVRTIVELDQIIELAKLHAKDYTETDFRHFGKLVSLLNETNQVKNYGAFSNKGELVSSATFLFSNKRAYYILVGNHPNGRTLGASHALIDAFIKDHAGNELILDFEGSDIRNLAFFYTSFGANEEKYAAIKLNRLPWWIKWLKN